MEIKNHSPEEVLTQILMNQQLLLEVAMQYVLPNVTKDRKWLDLHGRLVDEYHRTREITGFETVGEFWKRERK
jgi:hypothetical protein